MLFVWESISLVALVNPHRILSREVAYAKVRSTSNAIMSFHLMPEAHEPLGCSLINTQLTIRVLCPRAAVINAGYVTY